MPRASANPHLTPLFAKNSNRRTIQHINSHVENLNPHVAIFLSLRRNRKIVRNFNFILPKFHFILPNFYIAPP